MNDFRARIDGNEPCGLCGKPRKDHWGRRNGLAPQKLGHQWRPVQPEFTDFWPNFYSPRKPQP